MSDPEPRQAQGSSDEQEERRESDDDGFRAAERETDPTAPTAHYRDGELFLEARSGAANPRVRDDVNMRSQADVRPRHAHSSGGSVHSDIQTLVQLSSQIESGEMDENARQEWNRTLDNLWSRVNDNPSNEEPDDKKPQMFSSDLVNKLRDAVYRVQHGKDHEESRQDLKSYIRSAVLSLREGRVDETFRNNVVGALSETVDFLRRCLREALNSWTMKMLVEQTLVDFCSTLDIAIGSLYLLMAFKDKEQVIRFLRQVFNSQLLNILHQEMFSHLIDEIRPHCQDDAQEVEIVLGELMEEVVLEVVIPWAELQAMASPDSKLNLCVRIDVVAEDEPEDRARHYESLTAGFLKDQQDETDEYLLRVLETFQTNQGHGTGELESERKSHHKPDSD